MLGALAWVRSVLAAFEQRLYELFVLAEHASYLIERLGGGSIVRLELEQTFVKLFGRLVLRGLLVQPPGAYEQARNHTA